MKTALITGVTGQAGFYLSALLLEKEYRVVGTTRDIRMANRPLKAEVELVSLDLTNYEQVIDLIDELRPDEIYHFAAPSSVARSFGDPVRTSTGIMVPTLNILESIRTLGARIRFLDAASIEMFGDCRAPADESTPLDPHSPYGVAKTTSYLQTKNYREAFELHSCSAIFSNFESPLRPVGFVTGKIVSTACQIARGDKLKLKLGNVEIFRDWGWAPEYMEAAWRMMQLDEPRDLVIATGKKRSLGDFLRIAFDKVNLNYEDHVTSDSRLLRPYDIQSSVGSPEKARRIIQWSAQYSLEDLIGEWIDVEITRSGSQHQSWNKLYSLPKK